MSYQTKVTPFGPGHLIHICTPMLRVSLATLGAAVNSIKVLKKNKDKEEWIEVNVAYDTYEEALKDDSYMGVSVGRFAGRINKGIFKMDDKTYKVKTNKNYPHTLHGGPDAFDKKEWQFTIMNNFQRIGVEFFYFSPHDENGFPGELQNRILYYIPKMFGNNKLHMEYMSAVTHSSPVDKTIVNIFNHCYLNLNGVPNRKDHLDPNKQVSNKKVDTVHNIILHLPHSTRCAETNREAIPTGKLLITNKDSPLYFHKPTPIGKHINAEKVLNRNPCGFDHPYAIDNYKKHTINLNAIAHSPSTGIRLKVLSTFPCIWIYTANNLPKYDPENKNSKYFRHQAVCMEPQHFPDSCNRPEFPSPVISKGHPYKEKIIFDFAVLPEKKHPSKL